MSTVREALTLIAAIIISLLAVGTGFAIFAFLVWVFGGPFMLGVIAGLLLGIIIGPS